VLAFAGPGQGSALRDQKLRFRPDWDAVVTPAVDWLLARPDVDPNRIALMGMSLGGLRPALPWGTWVFGADSMAAVLRPSPP
jgi:hypothetical protein